MHTTADNIPLSEEPRWAGVREVMVMSGPIILGTLSYTIMDFFDKIMVAQLGPEELAGTSSAGLWSYTLATVFLGILGCVSTFVSQAIGRGESERSASYAWAGIYLALGTGVLALCLWPFSGLLFGAMQHEPETTRIEVLYFNIRLLSYVSLAWNTALAAFFQAVNRPMIATRIAIFVNVIDIFLNYVLIFGKLGFPRMEVAGAAWSTVFAMWLQAALLTVVFLGPTFNRLYKTRANYRIDFERIRELVRIGLPNGLTFFLDIANWAIFTSFIVGYFGTVHFAAHSAAISLMHLAFMPAVAINQGIAPIVGRWIGMKDYARAKARTYTALKITCIYMAFIGLINAMFGSYILEKGFTDEPAVVALGHRLLILAAIFQGFDAITIVCAGALRGAGDTRWMMWVTFISAYLIFLPLALLLAFPLGGTSYGAWVGATVYIIVLSGFLFWRFHGEKWRYITIFSDDMASPIEAPVQLTPFTAAEAGLPLARGEQAK